MTFINIVLENLKTNLYVGLKVKTKEFGYVNIYTSLDFFLKRLFFSEIKMHVSIKNIDNITDKYGGTWLKVYLQKVI